MPQVTQDQLDLWLDHPVTKAYLDALNAYDRFIEKAAGSGSYIDANNNDRTCYNFAYAAGARGALLEAQHPEAVLAKFERGEVTHV